VGFIRGGQTAIRRLQNSIRILKPAFQPLETAAQNDHLGTWQNEWTFFPAVRPVPFPRPGWNSFGIQELRVRQQIADAVIGNYFERGDVGITAEAGIVTRARR
jgi:hypothetical protein